MSGRRTAIVRVALVVLAAGRGGVAVAAEPPAVSLAEAARRLEAGGYVLMMRHAQTEPGLGDPAGYRLDDCATQRNLSVEGRAQAGAAGRALRAAGVRLAEVRSSAWCRCRDTARLAFGEHAVWPALNSFFDDRAAGPARTEAVAALARELRPPRNVMLVTHQVNITAASGIYPQVGEIVALAWRGGRMTPEIRFKAED